MSTKTTESVGASVKGNPASAQPLSSITDPRILKLLAHRRLGFCTPIEPVGSGIARQALRKAAI
jgi:hypothetical protein